MTNHLERARQLMEVRRHDLAVKELHAALQGDPGNVLAHLLLARCFLALGRLKEALGKAREAVGLAPDFAYAHHVLSCVYDRMERWDMAKEASLESLRLAPEDADYHGQLSFIYVRVKQWVGARNIAERGLELDPDHVSCLNNLAWALAGLGHHSQALRVLDTALRLDPSNSATHSNLGRMLHNLGRNDRAADRLHESLRLNPDQEDDSKLLRHTIEARVVKYLMAVACFLTVLGFAVVGDAGRQRRPNAGDIQGIQGQIFVGLLLVLAMVIGPFLVFGRCALIPRLVWIDRVIRVGNPRLVPFLLRLLARELGCVAVVLTLVWLLAPRAHYLAVALSILPVLATAPVAFRLRGGLAVVLRFHAVSVAAIGVAGVYLFSGGADGGDADVLLHRAGLTVLSSYLFGAFLLRTMAASAAAFQNEPI